MTNKSKKRAFCFDLDGTVTSQEILPMLAKEVNLYEEIDTLTKVTMKGIIPFKNSFRLRVKLLSDIPIDKVQKIISKVQLQQRIQQFINENRSNCFIVTGNIDVWIKELKMELNCPFYTSEADIDGNKLLGLKKILDKSDAVYELKKEFDEIVAIGDGMNDASMFEAADISIAYGAIHDPVETLIKIANYVTYGEDGLLTILNSLNTVNNEY